MPFPENELLKAWQRAGGRCECERTAHYNHAGKHFLGLTVEEKAGVAGKHITKQKL